MEKIRILIDTSAYAAFLRGNPEIKDALRQADEIFLNPIVIGEWIAGFLMGKKEKKNRAILRDFLSSPRVETLDMDEETSERDAVIFSYLRSRGTPIPTNDLWIACSAMQHGLKLLATDQLYFSVPQVLTEYYPENRE